MCETTKRLFDLNLFEKFHKKNQSSSHLTGSKYQSIIDRLIAIEDGDKKVMKDYRLLRNFELVEITSGNKTVQRLQRPGTDLIYVSHDDMFDAIREIHLMSGHGARDTMHDQAKKQYVNLTKEVLQLYSDLCIECQSKRAAKKPRVIFVEKEMGVPNFQELQANTVDTETEAEQSTTRSTPKPTARQSKRGRKRKVDGES